MIKIPPHPPFSKGGAGLLPPFSKRGAGLLPPLKKGGGGGGFSKNQEKHAPANNIGY